MHNVWSYPGFDTPMAKVATLGKVKSLGSKKYLFQVYNKGSLRSYNERGWSSV